MQTATPPAATLASLAAASAETEYVDQVPRRQAYEAAHPNVEIRYLGPYWKAIIRQDTGQTTITRVELRQLLDMLESLEPGTHAVSPVMASTPGRPARSDDGRP